MNHLAVVLTFILVALSATHADEVQCDRPRFRESVKKLRTQVQTLKSLTKGNFLLATEIGNSATELMERMTSLTKNCSQEDQRNFNFLAAFFGAMIAGEVHISEFTLSNIREESLREDAFSLICAVDCNAVFEFVEGLEDAESKVQVYQYLMNIMQNTHLNNTELMTSVQFIRKLNKLALKETDTTVSEMLHRLLRQAIKTDMVLRHDNLEALYELNHDATAAVVEEVVSEHLNTTFETTNDVEGFPLFDMIRCTTKKAIWLQHLEMVFNKLRESNKVKSLYSLMLLKQLTTLEKLVDGVLKDKVVTLKNKVPAMMENVLSGELCVQLDEEVKEHKAYIFSKQEESNVMKFVANNNGPLTAIHGQFGKNFLTIFVKNYDQKQDVFDTVDVTMEHGELIPIAIEEFPKFNGAHMCLPLSDAMPPAELLPSHFGAIKNLAKFLVHSQIWE